MVFAYIFGPTIKEVLKELTDCGYHYFTGRGSHYERSDQLPLQFEDQPIIPKPSAVTMVTKDREILRHWMDSLWEVSTTAYCSKPNNKRQRWNTSLVCLVRLLLQCLFRLY